MDLRAQPDRLLQAAILAVNAFFIGERGVTARSMAERGVFVIELMKRPGFCSASNSPMSTPRIFPREV